MNCSLLDLTVKDKAEALFEVEKLRRVKDELSIEVSSLHAQLEQERSKVRALTADSKSKAQVTLRYFTVHSSTLCKKYQVILTIFVWQIRFLICRHMIFKT